MLVNIISSAPRGASAKRPKCTSSRPASSQVDRPDLARTTPGGGDGDRVSTGVSERGSVFTPYNTSRSRSSFRGALERAWRHRRRRRALFTYLLTNLPLGIYRSARTAGDPPPARSRDAANASSASRPSVRFVCPSVGSHNNCRSLISSSELLTHRRPTGRPVTRSSAH